MKEESHPLKNLIKNKLTEMTRKGKPDEMARKEATQILNQNNLIFWVTHNQAVDFLSFLKILLNNLKESCSKRHSSSNSFFQIRNSFSELFQNLISISFQVYN